MAGYKGTIKFISSGDSSWALVDERPNVEYGDVSSAVASYVSQIEPSAAQVATVISTVSPSASETFDLSTNHNISITIDSGEATEIDIQGETPASTTVDEIISAINTALDGTYAVKVGAASAARIRVSGLAALTSGMVIVDDGASASALADVFNATTLTDYGTNPYFDLSTNYNVDITIDTSTGTVDLRGETPAMTTITEIADLINAAFPGSPAEADLVNGRPRIVITGSVASASGQILIESSTSHDARGIIFDSEDVAVYGTTSADNYESAEVTLRLIKANFSAKAVGDVIYYNYNSYTSLGSGHEITMV